MKLYLNILSNDLIGIDLEPRSENDIEIDCDSIEQFYKYVNEKDLNVDESIEFQLQNIFDDSVSSGEEQFTIKHWVSNRSIGELIDMFDSGEIIKPTMQRNLVWDSLKCSRLIESVLMGLPIPPLFMIEVDNSKYELVDGLQRISTFTNYLNGYSWQGNKETGRAAKLSSHVMPSIAGRTFDELSEDQKRILRRSTIPLIEFKQLKPENNEAKYLIFERINTGSIKLTEMQIRKALAYGDFIDSLYEMANANKDFVSLFSTNAVKKDAHVEAALRIMAITEIYTGQYDTKEKSIGKILNAYCESKRNETIDGGYIDKFNKAINLLVSLFSKKENICCRVLPRMGTPKYSGSLQVTILESVVGTIISNDINHVDEFETKYQTVMLKMFEDSVRKMDFKNPFNYSTGTREAINNRYKICEEILLSQ